MTLNIRTALLESVKETIEGGKYKFKRVSESSSAGTFSYKKQIGGIQLILNGKIDGGNRNLSLNIKADCRGTILATSSTNFGLDYSKPIDFAGVFNTLLKEIAKDLSAKGEEIAGD